MSAHVVTAELSPPTLVQEAVIERPPSMTRAPRAGSSAIATLLVAGVLCLATFLAGGGLHLASMTTLELVLTLASGAIVAGAVALAPSGTRFRGLWTIALLLAFTALTGLSVAWSVAPDASWQDAGRMLAYSSVFAAAVSLAWMAPGGWRSLLGATVLAAVIVCGYALLTKILPNQMGLSAEANFWARLQEPYGYWNAIGLMAAMGAIGCLWLGARRAGHALLSALAYPAMGLMIVTIMFAYSRGALAALLIGVVAWMCLVPLRLRGARVLIVAALGAGPVVAWDFSKHALSSDGVALAARTTAGHQLGVLLGAMVVVLTIVGIAIGFFGDRRAPSASSRRAVGILLAALLGLAVVGLVGGLATSKRGLTGTISHDLASLTDPNAKVPNTPGRLTAVSSVRARYWKEALEIFKAHPALGAGAAGYETARLRYRTQPLDVRQAHGYVVQTLADLGILGLLLTLALLVAWTVAAGRPTHPFNRRWTAQRSPPSIGWTSVPLPYTPERIGMLTMLCVVIVFGVHSLADWTWYVPGDACVALLCAGWLAGRGTLPSGNLLAPAGTPESVNARTHAVIQEQGDLSVNGHSPSGERASKTSGPTPFRIAVAIVLVATTLLAAWTEWQPQRSVSASEQALVLLNRSPVAARAAAQAAVDRDPLSVQALFTLSAVERATGQPTLARESLQKAVRLQPSNPQAWLELGQHDMANNSHVAVDELRAAVYLDPDSIPIQNVYVQALRTVNTPSRASGPLGVSDRKSGETQKRLRRPLASRTRRANGNPPTPATVTSAKPKSASRLASERRA